MTRLTFPMTLDRMFANALSYAPILARQAGYNQLAKNVYIHTSAKIDPRKTKIGRNVVIGPNAIVANGSCLQFTVIGENCRIGNVISQCQH